MMSIFKILGMGLTPDQWKRFLQECDGSVSEFTIFMCTIPVACYGLMAVVVSYDPDTIYFIVFLNMFIAFEYVTSRRVGYVEGTCLVLMGSTLAFFSVFAASPLEDLVLILAGLASMAVWMQFRIMVFFYKDTLATE